MTPPLTFAPSSTVSQESRLRRGGRSPSAPERAGVTGACGFINKYLSVCCSNEQGSNLKWSEQPPGMRTSRTGCWRQSNVKVHQRGTSRLPTPIQTDESRGRGAQMDPLQRPCVEERRGQTALFRPLLDTKRNFRSLNQASVGSQPPEGGKTGVFQFNSL